MAFIFQMFSFFFEGKRQWEISAQVGKQKFEIKTKYAKILSTKLTEYETFLGKLSCALTSHKHQNALVS